MGLFNTVKFNDDLPENFLNDKYQWNIEMRNKYLESKIKSEPGQILSREKMFCKNASIFDLTGLKIWWGDLCPNDVIYLKGIYYILSEYKSFSNVPKKFIYEIKMNEDKFSNSPFRQYLPLEPTILEIKYVKGSAIARINDGKIETNEKLIQNNFQ